MGGDGGVRYQYRTMNEEDLDDLFGGQSPFSDFFETFFRSRYGDQVGARTRTTGRTRTRQTVGQDVESTVDMSLAQAYQGPTQDFNLTGPQGGTKRIQPNIPPREDQCSLIL